MFLQNPETGIVSHTDLYRLTPHIGLAPKSIEDIQIYFMPKEPKSKNKRKRRVTVEDNSNATTVFTSKQEAVGAFINHLYPECFTKMEVAGSLDSNRGGIAKSLRELMGLGAERKKERTKQNRRRKRNEDEAGDIQTNKTRTRAKNPHK